MNITLNINIENININLNAETPDIVSVQGQQGSVETLVAGWLEPQAPQPSLAEQKLELSKVATQEQIKRFRLAEKLRLLCGDVTANKFLAGAL